MSSARCVRLLFSFVYTLADMSTISKALPAAKNAEVDAIMVEYNAVKKSTRRCRRHSPLPITSSRHSFLTGLAGSSARSSGG